MIDPSKTTPKFSVDKTKSTNGAFGSYDNPTRNDKRKAELHLKKMIRENDERIINALWTEFENLVEDENFKFKKVFLIYSPVQWVREKHGLLLIK